MNPVTLPTAIAKRLSRILFATDPNDSILRHIGVRLTPGKVVFTATNGHILASLAMLADEVRDDMSLMLHGPQLGAALKSLGKIGTIRIDTGPREVRLSSGRTSAFVCRVEGVYPDVARRWTRCADCTWIPTIACLDSTLIVLAQTISGIKTGLLFASPVSPGLRMDRMWDIDGAGSPDAISISDIRTALTAPAYWSDGRGLVIMLMPITRSSSAPSPDLSTQS